MSTVYPRSISSNKSYKTKKFYTTSFQPISYYSSLSNLSPKNKKIINSFNQDECKENLDKKNYSIDIFRSRLNRTKPSPFYIHEKSVRLREEIDWINKLIYSKSNLNINKLIKINPSYLKNIDNVIKKEEEEREKEISEHLINEMRIENLTKIIEINNRLKNKDVLNVLISKRGIDNYNYKNFMYEMNKFKNNGINRWKNEFNRKFNEY